MDLTSSENSEPFQQASDIEWKGTLGEEQYGRMTVAREAYSAEGLRGDLCGKSQDCGATQGGD